MIQLHILLPMVSIALLFVLVTTGAYRRSISTTIYIISIVLAMNCIDRCDPKIAGAIIMGGAIVSLVRAVINTKDDTWIKRHSPKQQ